MAKQTTPKGTLVMLPKPFIPSKSAFIKCGFVFHPHFPTAPGTIKAELPAGWKCKTISNTSSTQLKIYNEAGVLRVSTFRMNSNNESNAEKVGSTLIQV